MKCTISSLELETLVSRINRGTVDLQPEFQRGEVWNKNKKQKLIDSILRGWPIPPILVVKSSNKYDEILDGQQRLVAIRDFCNNVFKIDGNILPCDNNITRLDKLSFNELSDEIKEVINRYTINLVYLEDFEPSEPAELFDRFNQPMKLTPAEQRNAYFGKARTQVKSLVKIFADACNKVQGINFNNNRLVYDDLIARFCYALKIKTLDKKIMPSDITEIYRSEEGFEDIVINECERIIEKFVRIVSLSNLATSFSVASIFSWWIFLYSKIKFEEYDLSIIMFYFESICDMFRGKNKDDSRIKKEVDKFSKEVDWCESLFLLYIQKMSYASTDSLSVKTRDLLLTIFSNWFIGNKEIVLKFDERYHDYNKNFIETVNNFIVETDWGKLDHEK